MVEFAMIAPIFFLLLFAVIQLGLLFGAQNGLVNAVRDSTRRAATYRINEASFDGGVTIGGICTTIRQEIDRRLQQMPGFVTANRTATIDYEWKANNDTPQTFFLVAHITVQYFHPLYVPLVGLFLDGTDGTNDGRLRLEASEQMRVENPDILTSGADQTCP
jgi:Flp pilus assembly protein TadG